MSELLLRSAAELAALVRAGDLTPRELVEASLRRIDELQPRINAFTHVAHEAALAEADDDPDRATRVRSPACRSRSRTTAR